MRPKEVLLVLTDRWADWETSIAIAEVNSVPQFVVITIAAERSSKSLIGGIRVGIDCAVAEYQITYEELLAVKA